MVRSRSPLVDAATNRALTTTTFGVGAVNVAWLSDLDPSTGRTMRLGYARGGRTGGEP